MTKFGHSWPLLFTLLFSSFTQAVVIDPNLPHEGVVQADNHGNITPDIDYERFSGRVTDKDESGRIFKINVENNNTKFFRSGDKVQFKVNMMGDRQWCVGFVRSVEDFYFTVYVERLSTCFPEGDYFKRGTVLNFYSKILGERVFEATKYRSQLVLRKEDFLQQLNGINHFIWTFDQQKVKTAAAYDEEINRLQREKRRALDDLINQKQEKIVLQNELMKKLNELDESLKFFRVERQELMTDRWESDHDVGLPFGQRPQPVKPQ